MNKKKRAKPSEKAVIVRETVSVPGTIIQQDSGATNLLQIALDKKVDIPTLEALIRMRTEEEDRQNKRIFEEKFAEAQVEFPAVHKDKKAMDGQKVLYKYCPIENILTVYGPILARHGFSFRWDEKPLEGNNKELTCFLSGWGYTKTASMIVPIMLATSFSNAIQQSASSTSYGKRYTFCSVVGVIISGEDDDGRFNELKNIQDSLQLIFKRMGNSKLYSGDELIMYGKMAAEAKEDIDKLKNLLMDWGADLSEKEGKGKKK